MKKRMLSLLLCACMLVSALSVTALAAESEVLSDTWKETALYLDGEKLLPTAEGTTHTFENGGVATLTTVGQNEAGGTDYALTLENVLAFQSVRANVGDNICSAGLFFVCGGEATFFEPKDTLVITLKGQNIISVQGQADEAVASAVVTTCPVTLGGDGSLAVMAAPAEGAKTHCSGINTSFGDLCVGATLHCMVQNGPALTLGGELSFTDGVTLRWPLEPTLSEPDSTSMGMGSRTLMDGEAVAGTMVATAPSVPVTRNVAVFNLWQAMGAPAPEGEYPFADPTVDYGDIPLRDAVHWAGTTGLVKGYGNGLFGDMDVMTHEQLAVVLYNLAGSPAVEGDFAADFPYAATVSSWAKDAVLWAVSQGSEAMDPKAPLTHAEMDSLLAAISQKG